MSRTNRDKKNWFISYIYQEANEAFEKNKNKPNALIYYNDRIRELVNNSHKISFFDVRIFNRDNHHEQKAKSKLKQKLKRIKKRSEKTLFFSNLKDFQ